MPKSAEHDVLSKQEEQRLIAAGRRVLLSGGFPNPERAGCPHSDVLKAIAFRRISLTEATQYIDHVGGCSPCFIEYTALRKDAQRRKTLELALIAAAVLIAISTAGWLWKVYRFQGIARRPTVATVTPYQSVTLDLRGLVVPRGKQLSSANPPPLRLPRGRLDLTILLPIGSELGTYEVQVLTELNKPLVNARGIASIQNGITALKTTLDISKVYPGPYVLSLSQRGEENRVYPLVVH